MGPQCASIGGPGLSMGMYPRVQRPIQRPQGVPKLLRVPPALSHCLRIPLRGALLQYIDLRKFREHSLDLRVAEVSRGTQVPW